MKHRIPHLRGVNVLIVGALMGSATMAGAAAVADDTFGPTPLGGQNGTTLAANVNATAHLTKTHQWTLDKSVTPATLNLFRGDSGEASYTVTATRDQGTTAASISGEVRVTNGGGVATQDLAITARVTHPANGPQVGTSQVDVSANPVLDPSEQGLYNYTIPLGPNADAGEYKVTADVTITNHSGSLGDPKGPSPSATTTMSSTPTVVHGGLDVTDSNGKTWTFNDSGSQVYSQTFTSANKGTNTNTVTSKYGEGGEGPSDDATVTVNSYDLGVTKTVDTSLTRTYSWDLDKSADQSALTLAMNQQYNVNYTVKVSSKSADSDYAASGTITVTNPAPMDATLTKVTDAVGSVAATVTPVTGSDDAPYIVPAGGTREFSYTVDLPSGASATNTATATLQNTPSGTTDFTGEAAVDFAEASVTEVDETATVTDT
jgi:hypothetical protein